MLQLSCHKSYSLASADLAHSYYIYVYAAIILVKEKLATPFLNSTIHCGVLHVCWINHYFQQFVLVIFEVNVYF